MNESQIAFFLRKTRPESDQFNYQDQLSNCNKWIFTSKDSPRYPPLIDVLLRSTDPLSCRQSSGRYIAPHWHLSATTPKPLYDTGNLLLTRTGFCWRQLLHRKVFLLRLFDAAARWCEGGCSCPRHFAAAQSRPVNLYTYISLYIRRRYVFVYVWWAYNDKKQHTALRSANYENLSVDCRYYSKSFFDTCACNSQLFTHNFIYVDGLHKDDYMQLQKKNYGNIYKI